MKTATLRKVLDKNKVLFELSQPAEVLDYDDDDEYTPVTKWTNFVVVSKGRSYFESYIFASNENGDITNWSELAGSEKNIYSFTKPLINAGYRVVLPPAFKLLFKE